MVDQEKDILEELREAIEDGFGEEILQKKSQFADK